MSGELVSWFGGAGAVEIRHDRALERVNNRTDLAIARVMGVAQVAQTAMLGTLGLAMMQKEAAFMAPQAAEKFEMITVHAAVGMANVINRLAQQ
jgi:hypothetical protein